MPCMPHFHDHFIPSTWVVLRKKDNTPAAAAPAVPIESVRQETLLPFREAYEAVRTFMNEKAAEELQARQQLQPRTV